MLSHAGVPLGSLRLDNRQWQSVVTPKHIIDESLSGFIRHPCHGEFPIPFLIESPSRLLQQQVDEIIPRLSF